MTDEVKNEGNARSFANAMADAVTVAQRLKCEFVIRRVGEYWAATFEVARRGLSGTRMVERMVDVRNENLGEAVIQLVLNTWNWDSIEQVLIILPKGDYTGVAPETTIPGDMIAAVDDEVLVLAGDVDYAHIAAGDRICDPTREPELQSADLVSALTLGLLEAEKGQTELTIQYNGRTKGFSVSLADDDFLGANLTLLLEEIIEAHS